MKKCKKCKKEFSEMELINGKCIYCLLKSTEKIYTLSNSIIILFSAIVIVPMFYLTLSSFVNSRDEWLGLGEIFLIFYEVVFCINFIPLILSAIFVRRFLFNKNKNGIKIGRLLGIITLIINLITIFILSRLKVLGNFVFFGSIFIIIFNIFYMIMCYKYELKEKGK